MRMSHVARSVPGSDPLADPLGQLVAALSAICARMTFAVQCAYLFGSVARTEEGPLSDLDLAVLFDDDVPASRRLEQAAEIVEEAERMTGRQVDILILNEAPPALRYRVVCDGRVLYARDERGRIAFEARALDEFLDFKPTLALYDRLLLARAREGRLGT